jgi:hypothetical protein
MSTITGAAPGLDITAAHRQAEIAGSQQTIDRGCEVAAVRHGVDVEVGMGRSDRSDDEVAGHPGDRGLTARIDVGDHDDVGVDEGVRVRRRQRDHAVGSVRLEHGDDAGPRVSAGACGAQHGGDLAR